MARLPVLEVEEGDGVAARINAARREAYGALKPHRYPKTRRPASQQGRLSDELFLQVTSVDFGAGEAQTRNVRHIERDRRARQRPSRRRG